MRVVPEIEKKSRRANCQYRTDLFASFYLLAQVENQRPDAGPGRKNISSADVNLRREVVADLFKNKLDVVFSWRRAEI